VGWWLFLGVIVVSAQGVDYRYDLGVSAGTWFAGDIDVSDDLDDDDFSEDLRKNGSLFIRAFADVIVARPFAFGAYVNFATIGFDEAAYLGYWDGRAHEIPASGIKMAEAGALLRLRISIARFLLRPGLDIGYRRTFSDSEDARAKGLALNGGCEVHYRINERLAPFLDVGFLSQPYGGVSDVAYVMFGPIAYVTAGIVLSPAGVPESPLNP
jgi:hypothetical protein